MPDMSKYTVRKRNIGMIGNSDRNIGMTSNSQIKLKKKGKMHAAYQENLSDSETVE